MGYVEWRCPICRTRLRSTHIITSNDEATAFLLRCCRSCRKELKDLIMKLRRERRSVPVL